MPNVGETVGSYELVRKLGAGAFGEVWLARHIELGFERAMKIPTDSDYIQQLRKEGQIQFTLKHPNIVETFDLDTHHTTPHLVMEYVEGEDLRKRLRARGKLPPTEALPIVRQILDALHAAHAQGIVHHDLKPENILLAADGTVKVADFGLGRVQATVAQSLLLSGSMVSREGKSVSGTFEYMSPEQQRGEPADPRDDLYALGVIGCELLTGRRPTGLGVAKMFEREKLDPTLSDLFEKALDDRDHAYRSATDMLAAMRDAAAERKTGYDVVLHEVTEEKRRRAEEERRARAERRRRTERERREQEGKQAEARRQSRAEADAERRRRDSERQRLEAEQKRVREREAPRARPVAQQPRPPVQPAVILQPQEASSAPPARTSAKGVFGCLTVIVIGVLLVATLRVNGIPFREWLFNKSKSSPEQPPTPKQPPVLRWRGLPSSSSLDRRLSISVDWSTQDADVDLIVVEPDGTTSRLRRSSRRIPPRETWSTEDARPGRYEVSVQYCEGCTVPTTVSLDVVLHGKRPESPAPPRILRPGSRETIAFVEVR